MRVTAFISSKLPVAPIAAILYQPQEILRKRIAAVHQAYYVKRRNRCDSVAAMACFKGHSDRYNGVTVISQEEACAHNAFLERLQASLESWLKDGKRTAWFHVYLSESEWIPILVKYGFTFHHARGDCVTLFRWLSENEECNVPPYAHTNLGVGAFVYNDKTNELLVIKEKYTKYNPFWKLPGGYVERGEDITEAIQREVLEETGIQANFECLIAFRHGHDYAFECSDIYMIAYLTPATFDIRKNSREISECCWMALNDYANHTDVHTNNKLIAMRLQEFLEHRMGFTVKKTLHPVTGKPISVYSIAKI